MSAMEQRALDAPEPWATDLRLLLAAAKAARLFLAPGGARLRGRLAAAVNALDSSDERI